MREIVFILFCLPNIICAATWPQTLRPPISNPKKLIYGNAEIGYFERSFTSSSKDISLLPPLFEKPIVFAWFKKEGVSPRCEKKVFQSPRENSLPYSTFPIKGKLSAPFYLMNAHLGSKETGTSFVYITNKLGQIIWAHSPPNPQKPALDVRTLTLTVKPVGEGRYAILRPYEQSYFEVVDTNGQVLVAIDPKQSKTPYPIHHDFIWENDQSLLSLGHIKVFAKKWWKFWQKPTSFLSIPLLHIDLQKNEALPLWNYLQGKNPFHEIDWKFTSEDSGSFWYLWNEENAENNFEHINSIQKVGEEGYLLSLRSLNKLVFLSPDFKKILWTVGTHPKNTYSPKTPESNFYRQHHVTLIDANTLLLFDNGKTKSRILMLKLDPYLHTSEILHQYEPEQPYFSIRHGSAYRLENRNILGFFPNTVPERKGPGHLYEFDGQSARVLGEMEIDFGLNRVAFRATPLTQLVTEKYLGTENPTTCH